MVIRTKSGKVFDYLTEFHSDTFVGDVSAGPLFANAFRLIGVRVALASL